MEPPKTLGIFHGVTGENGNFMGYNMIWESLRTWGLWPLQPCLGSGSFFTLDHQQRTFRSSNLSTVLTICSVLGVTAMGRVAVCPWSKGFFEENIYKDHSTWVRIWWVMVGFMQLISGPLTYDPTEETIGSWKAVLIHWNLTNKPWLSTSSIHFDFACVLMFTYFMLSYYSRFSVLVQWNELDHHHLLAPVSISQ